jgi:hypothetical protein
MPWALICRKKRRLVAIRMLASSQPIPTPLMGRAQVSVTPDANNAIRPTTPS